MDFTDLIKYIVDNAYNHWCITALFLYLCNPFIFYESGNKEDDE